MRTRLGRIERVTSGLALLLVAGACEADAPFANDADPCLDAFTCPGTARCGPTCRTSLEEFRSFHAECEPTRASNEARYRNAGELGAGELDAGHFQAAGECRTASYDCDGLHAFVLSYAYDNVQCYYGDGGGLVGAVRTSDHGLPLEAGQLPSVYCDMAPRCERPDAGG